MLFRTVPPYLSHLPEIGGSQHPPKTPIENCGKTSARKGIVCMVGLYDLGGIRSAGITRDCLNFLAIISEWISK